MRFTRFVAVDWTGAKGLRHRAIQAAEADAGDGPPRLIRPGHRWSRTEIAEMIDDIAARGEPTLIGIDCSFSLPFVDEGAYFPGDAQEPSGPRALWAEIDRVAAAEPDLAAHPYIDARRRHFWCGAADGVQRNYSRLRLPEALHRERRMGNPCSPYVLVGASQVGKATLSGMRLLSRVNIPIWPFDPMPATGALLVEIYCQTFAVDGGFRGKLRTRARLNEALTRIGSKPATDLPDQFDDHVGDALVSAAGLRRAAADSAYWHPAPMTPEVARTEGWTFGIL
ncbi:hypothetical protein ACFOMD_05400 [Sphingoaurantiacus capsulatus]|uniref:DUF429 domain-containing protein n=1 Tax=Sphingoaurantiacus capsulatus TaxID=1771310 RepID=A0ABV7X945_9SPHN